MKRSHKFAMRIDLTNEQLDALLLLVKACNKSPQVQQGHAAKLSVAGLLEMLAADASMAYTRPGSWEGANMIDVLQGHGYLL